MGATVITIYLDTAQGIVVTNDGADGVDDVATVKLTEAVAKGAQEAYNEFMGIGEVVH